MNPSERICLHEAAFTPSERKIESFLLNNLDLVASYTIVEVAEFADVSKSALLRFCKKLGYSGYSEFKFEVSRFLLSGPEIDESPADEGEDFAQPYISCIEKIPMCLSRERLDDFACDLIRAASMKIFGVHESGLAAQYFAYRLAALGVDSEAVCQTSGFETKANFSKPGDLNIFVSVSGITSNIISALDASLTNGATTALLTMNDKAEAGLKAQHYLVLPSFEINKSVSFFDSQGIMFIGIDYIVSRLAQRLRKSQN